MSSRTLQRERDCGGLQAEDAGRASKSQTL